MYFLFSVCFQGRMCVRGQQLSLFSLPGMMPGIQKALRKRVAWMDGWMDGWVGGWMDGWMHDQTDEAPVGPRVRRLLNSAQAQTTAREAGDAPGPLGGHPHQAKPSWASPWRRRHDPPPPLGCSLGLLIWRWNARYPHSLPLGPRLLSPATATRG